MSVCGRLPATARGGQPRSSSTCFGIGSMAACGRVGNMNARRLIILATAVSLLSFPKSDQAAGSDRKPAKIDLFQTSDRCFACHNGLSTAAGEDISIGFGWRPTLMANSARDPYWQAGVRRETIDHPEAKKDIEDECSKCHMPMARYQSRYE